MLDYLRLFRADAALIAFFSYMAGAELAGGAGLRDLVAAGLVTFISTNFIYSFNSWADREIDAVNKPRRPIPAGRITAEKALGYSLFLLLLAVGYPFLIARSPLTFFLFELLPVLGLLYSARPFCFRMHPALSTPTISLGLVTPLMLGCFMNGADYRLWTVFVALFVYCLCVVPLKDIEDAEGDRAFGIRNLHLAWGDKLPLISLAGLTLDLAWIGAAPMPEALRIVVAAVVAVTMACIGVFRCLRLRPERLYKAVIRTAIVLSVFAAILFRWW